MSVENETVEEVVDEVVEETTDGAAQVETGETTETADETPAEFNPATLEATFGMPAGSLKDCKDQSEALDEIREYTDKVLIAGMGLEHTTGNVQKANETKATKAETKATGGNAELDALRAELVEVKQSIAKQTEAQEARVLAELDTRISSTIDSWKSPKYGVGKNRNFKQVKATRDLRQLLVTHVAGLQATGEPVVGVEMLLQRVRAFDDETFDPKKAGGATAHVLGTPGVGKDGLAKGGTNDKLPRSIHHALMANQS